MNCAQLRDSFELYSLGLLEDGEEKRNIIAHMESGCAACQAAMKDALVLQALLLSQAPEVLPPVRLKRRVMGAVGVQPMAWTWFAAACASAMLVAALWYGVVASERRHQRDEARAALVQAIAERDRLQAALRFLEDPQTKQVNFGDAQAVPPKGNVYVHPQLGVLLIAANLTPVAADRTYEMWILPKKGGAPQPAGLFRSTSDGSAVHTLGQALNLADVAGIAVTVEPAAGSQTPTLPILFVAQIG